MLKDQNLEIVLVEDDPYDAELLMRVFKKHNLTNKVILLKDGVEALKYLFKDGESENKSKPGIIFLDLKMPRVDGIEVLRQIKADDRTKEIPVIILTGSKEERDLKNAHSIGVTGYITKPLKSDRFATLMSELGLIADVSKTSVRILILDDITEDAELMKRELLKSGLNFMAEFAQDKNSFNNALEKFIPDIILADYNLPGFDGIYALRLARQRFPEIPVIIISGVIGEENAIETMKNGATDYVLKSRLSRLGPVVNRALQEARQVAERKLIENDLKLTQFAIDKMGDACIGLAPDARITYANDTACKMLGYSREELLSMRTYDYNSTHTEGNWAEHVADLKSQGSLKFEVEFRTKNGETVPVEVISNYIALDDREYIIAIARDITERRLLESNLLEKQERLEAQAEELEVQVEELRANNDELETEIHKRQHAEEELINANAQAELYLDLMGHDISNMHQIILGQLELAKEIMETDRKLDAADKELIDTSLNTLERSARLIDNVRNLQKLNHGEINEEIIDLDTLLSGIINEFENLVPAKSIKFMRTGSHYVKVNNLVHDVFTNLLNNSIKYSNGNILDIAIRLEKARLNGEDYHMVSIEDNGYGVPDHMKERIFNRLQRGETVARGMGLGLYIVKTLVNSYGGRVKVEDRVPGDHTKGARFLVYLPVMGDGNGNE